MEDRQKKHPPRVDAFKSMLIAGYATAIVAWLYSLWVLLVEFGVLR